MTWEHVTLDHLHNKCPLVKLSFAVPNVHPPCAKQGPLLHHPEPHAWCDTFRGMAVDGREHKGVLRLTDRGH
ncbi:hypothetical protein QBC32DRAFT_357091 [Pseudoneurospora amorphoporcata]|uniref:Uncharacterized protein n=1 Tax=Pseudoneurospora amorphoporcata TaxID=241081 RepID=A0AAN6NKV5_9PEZI|nr:hypothetical protein QBC32DRAFT_357091 [Pseudoneurospora amorphoporcata]